MPRKSGEAVEYFVFDVVLHSHQFSASYLPCFLCPLRSSGREVEYNYQVHHLYNALHPMLGDVERLKAGAAHGLDDFFVGTCFGHRRCLSLKL